MGKVDPIRVNVKNGRVEIDGVGCGERVWGSDSDERDGDTRGQISTSRTRLIRILPPKAMTNFSGR